MHLQLRVNIPPVAFHKYSGMQACDGIMYDPINRHYTIGTGTEITATVPGQILYQKIGIFDDGL